MNATELLKLLTTDDTQGIHPIKDRDARVYPVTNVGTEGMGMLFRVSQREVVVEGRRFLIQTIDLSGIY